MELLGIVLPLLTFLIPVININKFKQYAIEKIYWSRENILLQIVTIAINVPGIIYIWYEGYKDSVIPDTLEKLGKKVVEFLL